jgi:hypothetical protein
MSRKILSKFFMSATGKMYTNNSGSCWLNYKNTLKPPVISGNKFFTGAKNSPSHTGDQKAVMRWIF